MAVHGVLPVGNPDIVGADSPQSLYLALRLSASTLESFVEKGGKLTMEGEDFCIRAYFNQHLSFRSGSP